MIHIFRKHFSPCIHLLPMLPAQKPYVPFSCAEGAEKKCPLLVRGTKPTVKKCQSSTCFRGPGHYTYLLKVFPQFPPTWNDSRFFKTWKTVCVWFRWVHTQWFTNLSVNMRESDSHTAFFPLPYTVWCCAFACTRGVVHVVGRGWRKEKNAGFHAFISSPLVPDRNSKLARHQQKVWFDVCVCVCVDWMHEQTWNVCQYVRGWGWNSLFSQFPQKSMTRWCLAMAQQGTMPGTLLMWVWFTF